MESIDANGNLLTKTDARGIVATITYDQLNRVKTKTYANDGGLTPDVTYTYDNCIEGVGRLCSVAAAGVSTTNYLACDDLGRVLQSNQVTEGETYAFAYGYNLAGGLTRLTYPSGRVVSYGFDDAGRIEVAAPGMDLLSPDKYASQIQYHPHGAMSQVALGNGVVEGYGFNNRLQPVSITAVKGAETWLSLANYYCPNQQSGCASNNGNVLARTIDDGSSIYTQSFEYDGVNRLERASEVGGWVRDYVYDRFGNRAVRDTSYLPYPTRTPQVSEATASAVEAIFPNTQNSNTPGMRNEE